MDQTCDTADLKEMETFLNQVKDSSESDSDIEEEIAQDALLGGVRSGLSTITRTARKAVSTCKNKTELEDAIDKIESSTLKLLKVEKSFLKTASIVSQVIDELVSDYEDDPDTTEVCQKDANETQGDILGNADAICGSLENGSGDADPIAPSKFTTTPSVFQLSQKNLVSVVNFKERLTKEFHTRLNRYNDSLTDECLKEDDKFKALMHQINLGKTEAEDAMNCTNADGSSNSEPSYEGSNSNTSAFMSSIPFSKEDLQEYRYKPYNENDDMDDTVLPCIDPITKTPIIFPVRNKFCNHVFDKNSIDTYIGNTPNAKCPMHECRNNRILDISHFVTDPVLTSHIRQKNFGD